MNRVMIVGFPRSGTTVLQQVLCAGSRVYSSPETHYFSLLNPINKLANILIPKGMLYPRAKASLESATLMPCLSGRLPLQQQVFSNVFFHHMDRCARERGYVAWVEKTPRHLEFISDLKAGGFLFKAICIHRRPVDAINSLYDVTNKYSEEWNGRRSGVTLEYAVNRWVRDVGLAKQLYDNGSVGLVSYESLASRSPALLRDLELYTGIKSIGYDSAAVRSVILEKEVWKTNNSRDVFTMNKSYGNRDLILKMIPEKAMYEYEYLVENSFGDNIIV